MKSSRRWWGKQRILERGDKCSKDDWEHGLLISRSSKLTLQAIKTGLPHLASSAILRNQTVKRMLVPGQLGERGSRRARNASWKEVEYEHFLYSLRNFFQCILCVVPGNGYMVEKREKSVSMPHTFWCILHSYILHNKKTEWTRITSRSLVYILLFKLYINTQLYPTQILSENKKANKSWGQVRANYSRIISCYITHVFLNRNPQE